MCCLTIFPNKPPLKRGSVDRHFLIRERTIGITTYMGSVERHFLDIDHTVYLLYFYKWCFVLYVVNTLHLDVMGSEQNAQMAVCNIAHAIDSLCADFLRLRTTSVFIPCPWCRAANPSLSTATAQAQKVLLFSPQSHSCMHARTCMHRLAVCWFPRCYCCFFITFIIIIIITIIIVIIINIVIVIIININININIIVIIRQMHFTVVNCEILFNVFFPGSFVYVCGVLESCCDRTQSYCLPAFTSVSIFIKILRTNRHLKGVKWLVTFSWERNKRSIATVPSY